MADLYNLTLTKEERAYLLKRLIETLNQYELLITQGKNSADQLTELEEKANLAFIIHQKLKHLKTYTEAKQL